MKIFIKKYIRYPSEFILFAIFYFIFRLLPLSVARKLGVSITTSLGPLFSINKLIKKMSIKDIVMKVSQDREISKKLIYNYCLQIKNEN